MRYQCKSCVQGFDELDHGLIPEHGSCTGSGSVPRFFTNVTRVSYQSSADPVVKCQRARAELPSFAEATNKRVADELPMYGNVENQRNEFRHMALNDPLLHALIRSGLTPEGIIVALMRERAFLQDRVLSDV